MVLWPISFQYAGVGIQQDGLVYTYAVDHVCTKLRLAQNSTGAVPSGT
jgi:hypothetical protein